MVSEEEKAKIKDFLADYFPGNERGSTRVIHIELKLHTLLKIYAKNRGLSLQWATQQLIATGMECELNKAAEEKAKIKSCLT